MRSAAAATSTKRSGRRSNSAKTVRLFLAALKRFYGFAVGEGWYRHDDPLLPRLSFLLTSIRREAVRSLQDAGRVAAWELDIVSPSSPSSASSSRVPPQLTSGTYFRLKGAQWEPRPMLDADLPLRLQAAAGPARVVTA